MAILRLATSNNLKRYGIVSTLVLTLSMPLLASQSDELAAQTTQTTQLSMLWLDEAMPANEVLNISGSTMQLLWPGLSDVQVQSAGVNASRALALLASEPNACVGNKILTPEREAISYHTQLPQVVFPGLHIFALKNGLGSTALHELNSAAGVSL